MESSVREKNRKKIKRAQRVRKHLRGSLAQPRMSVLKSNQHLAVQLIDDEKSMTLGFAGTQMKELKDKKLGRSKKAAKVIGAKIAEIAKKKNISRVIFDRGSHKFHGVIAELAGAAREGGLQF